MNTSRIAILGMAFFAGVVAFFLMMNNEETPTAVSIVQPVKEETVRVLVAARPMQRGRRFTAEDTKWIDWPKNGMQPNFITDARLEDREGLTDAVAREMIVENEPIVEQKIVRAGSSGLMAAILSPGMRAVTLRVAPETASGGFILPGDKVDVVRTRGTRAAELLFADIRVLAVNTIVNNGGGEEGEATHHIPGANVTLEIAPGDAELLITAREQGQLNVVLRSIFQAEGDVGSPRRSRGVSVIRYGRS